MPTDPALPVHHGAATLRSRSFVVLIAAVLFIACGGRRELLRSPTPWVAPGYRVTAYFHHRSDPGLGGLEWRDTVRHRKYNPYRLADQIEQFMSVRGMFAHWPPTGLTDASDGKPIREVLAPFRFTLVSVDPMVVLMTRHAFPPNVGAYDLPGAFDASFPGIRRMKNNIEIGTTAPYADSIQFFLPEQGVGPATVQWANGEASIPIGAGERLLLARRDSIVEVRRASP